ncbi:hydroxymethylbilane synthase [Pseudofulvimonas gallinarii]|jgi:hydroxymethylbilane synthase|uniref:Porphobilinogen deaminase n=1 Tax=Pseudofulvimonas gallinarii TaxID=634155 RepID=A0A4S3L0U6_9GAMM|nr:hydroxymethylbilane synthase [Pseudofulvimonas gallinarii]TCS98819.1 hydroxymethylbilane synthase [Pseudofulvimonas gallinarii]THD14304.1 hydroxymethylbilane synthase [Pseudofulvimonas gallinarii]
MTILRIATRRSALALWQAEHVAARLRAAHTGLDVELLPMSTRGDEVLDTPLAAIGGKGLFLKELEYALLEGRADLAAHSLKDVPAVLEEPFALPAILERADPADAFVSNRYASLAQLPHGARVGTSSLRRQAQLRAARPDLELLDLRGNVNTRLARLDNGDYDAIILACAGLRRLGLENRITATMAAPDWLPGVGQGAIAIETRAGDEATAALLAPLHHVKTAACVRAERALNRALAGDCSVPIGAFATLEGERLHLHGLVGDASDGTLLRADAEGHAGDPEALGEHVAGMLRGQGAEALLGKGANGAQG